jgi:ABC-2 type transport system ATP-binding protein
MVQGKLVALDSPRGLKDTWVPGQVIAIHTREIARVRQSLTGLDAVLAVEPFGSTVHVRFDPSRLARAQIEQRIETVFAPNPVIEASDVSLEDVFLAAVASGATHSPGKPVPTASVGGTPA